jgi:outer membrane protein TolC
LQSQQQTLSLTEKLFNEGVGTRHDIVRSRAQTEATEAQLPALEASLIVSQRQLEALLGQQPGSLDAELQTIMALPKTPAQQLLTSPAVAELFPKISLSAFLGLRNTDIETLFKSAAFSYCSQSATANIKLWQNSSWNRSRRSQAKTGLF